MIHEWPLEWYGKFTSMTFRLQSLNLTAPHRWTGGKSTFGAIAQLWVVKLSLGPIRWNEEGQAMAAFFDNLGGQSGRIRIGDRLRQVPQRDRNLSGEEAWSDGTFFSDDESGFVDGLLPPFVTLGVAASRGATYVVLDGLPSSEVAVLRRGDHIEFRPNGIPSVLPALHTVVKFDGNTDADGSCGIYIAPPLRINLVAGDVAILSNPTSVFYPIDDEQGSPEITGPEFMNMGFTLIEAIVDG